MTAPKTDWVLVREPRAKGQTEAEMRIVAGNGKFDFSDYSFLRKNDPDVEEWVPTSELEIYKRVYGVK